MNLKQASKLMRELFALMITTMARSRNPENGLTPIRVPVTQRTPHQLVRKSSTNSRTPTVDTNIL